MPIYVDPLKCYGWIIRGREYESCHMICDGDLEELHQMAEKIGLKRKWFQDKKNRPHYDLIPKKRELAIQNGAIEITTRESIQILQRFR